MTTTTNQERAREIAERVARAHYRLPEGWPFAPDSTIGNLVDDVADALLSFAPSPSDEVRGLIERAQGRLQVAAKWATARLGDNGWQPRRHNIEGMRNTINDAIGDLATLSTTPSSSVSGEGDDLAVELKSATTVDEALTLFAAKYAVRAHMSMSPDELSRAQKEIKDDALATFAYLARPYLDRAIRAEAAIAPSRPPEPAVSGEAEPAMWVGRKMFSGTGNVARATFDTAKEAKEAETRFGYEITPLYTHPPGGDVRARAIEECKSVVKAMKDRWRESDLDAEHNYYESAAKLIWQKLNALSALPVPDDETPKAEAVPGDMDPHDDIEKTVAVVRAAYGWQVDKEGRLYGLVGGDMGYAATSIVLGEDDRWEKPKSPDDETKRLREEVIEECAKVAARATYRTQQTSLGNFKDTPIPHREAIAGAIRALASPKPPVEGTKP
jgi:hypothetical protein